MNSSYISKYPCAANILEYLVIKNLVLPHQSKGDGDRFTDFVAKIPTVLSLKGYRKRTCHVVD